MQKIRLALPSSCTVHVVHPSPLITDDNLSTTQGIIFSSKLTNSGVGHEIYSSGFLAMHHCTQILYSGLASFNQLYRTGLVDKKSTFSLIEEAKAKYLHDSI
jgi:hypothetical protein